MSVLKNFAVRFVLCFSVSAVLPLAAQQQVSFNRTTYQNAPFDVTAIDVNHDGFADLVSIPYGGGSNIRVLLNNQHGGFTMPGTVYKAISGDAICALAAGDLDGDGNNDVVVSDYTDNGGRQATGVQVNILYGEPGGAFKLPVPITVPGIPGSIVMGDFNRDGKKDIAVALNGNSKLVVLMNRGGRTFSAPFTFLTTAQFGLLPSSLAVGDINGDGKQDLALLMCCVDNNEHVNILRMTNTTPIGGLTPTFNVSVVEKGTAKRLILADLDKDGRADYVVTYYPGSACQAANCSNIQGVTWRYNNANGTTTKAGFPFAVDGRLETSSGVAVGDFNGDGINDVAFLVGTLNNTNENVRYLLGTGSRHFGPLQNIAIKSGEFPFQLTSADLDHNKLFDLVTVAAPVAANAETEVLLSHKK